MSEFNEQLKSQIDDVFKRQQCHALGLRKSDYRQRLEVLSRFETAFAMHRKNISIGGG